MSAVRAIQRRAARDARARRRARSSTSPRPRRKRPSAGMPEYSVTKAAMLSLSRLVADLYAKDGIRCNAVTPGPTATEAWLGEGGLADQQGEREEMLAKVGAGPAARPARRARGDRRRDRLPLLRPRELRHRRGVERRRRHRPDHHLSALRRWPGTGRADTLAACLRGADCSRVVRRADAQLEETRCRRSPSARTRRAAALDARGGVRRAHAVPARPRPHRPLEAVPAAEGQDAGLHRPGRRPLPDAHDPHARDDGDRPRRRPRAAAERGPRRGDRARPRHRPHAVRPRRRGGARRGARASGSAAASATTSSRCGSPSGST